MANDHLRRRRQQTAHAERQVRIDDLTFEISVLRACACEYPIMTLLNGIGHDDECPGAALMRSRRAN